MRPSTGTRHLDYDQEALEANVSLEPAPTTSRVFTADTAQGRSPVNSTLAGLVVRGIIDETDAPIMATELAYGLAKRAYRLDGRRPGA